MKISLAELLVMKDTLRGSLMMHDRGMLWSYDKKTREDVLMMMEKMVNSVTVDIEITEALNDE